MFARKNKPFIISAAITVFEFIAFVIWGKNMTAGDEMGFFIITTYFLFPLTTLIISAYLSFRKPLALLVFIPLMFAAQNFMPFILTGTFEVGLISILTFVPILISILVVSVINIIKEGK